jgi:hypothetical protein
VTVNSLPKVLPDMGTCGNCEKRNSFYQSKKNHAEWSLLNIFFL